VAGRVRERSVMTDDWSGEDDPYGYDEDDWYDGYQPDEVGPGGSPPSRAGVGALRGETRARTRPGTERATDRRGGVLPVVPGPGGDRGHGADRPRGLMRPPRRDDRGPRRQPPARLPWRQCRPGVPRPPRRHPPARPCRSRRSGAARDSQQIAPARRGRPRRIRSSARPGSGRRWCCAGSCPAAGSGSATCPPPSPTSSYRRLCGSRPACQRASASGETRV